MKVQRLIELLLAVAVLAGCAVEPMKPGDGQASASSVVHASKDCGEPVTGSHLSRCGATGVQTMSREDYERQVPAGPAMTRSTLRSGTP